MSDTDPQEHPGETLRRLAVKLAALAQDGTTFAVNEYDIDRFRQITAVSAGLFAVLSGRPASDFVAELGRDTGYATPKVDVRGVLFDDADRVLLMREKVDGLWSLPGGWADPLDTPAEAVVREVREETGYRARATKLIACWDRDRQGHTPALPVSIYKLFFLCEQVAEAGDPDALETLDVGWFDVDDLPELSTGRVLAPQIEIALAHHRDPSLPTAFD